MLWPPAFTLTAPATSRYVMHGHGSPVRPDEVGQASRLAVELVVLWDGDVLSVSHIAAPCAVFVGEGEGCEVALPAERLGAERRCVALSSDGDVCAMLPGGVPAWLTLPDGSIHHLAQTTRGLELGSSEAREQLLPLPVGYRAHLCFAQLEIQVATVHPGRPCPRVLGVDGSLLASLGLCTLTLAGVMALLSRLVPAAGLNADERAESAQRQVLRTYLAAAAKRAVEPGAGRASESSRPALAKPPPRQPASHEAADIDREPTATLAPSIGLDPIDVPATHPVQRREQIQAARKYGVIGMLDWPELRDPKLKFERHMTSDELALMEQLFKPESAPRLDGPGGLTLSGTGLGGGGKADVVALGTVRTVDEAQGGTLDRWRDGKSIPDMHQPQPQPLGLPQRESIVSAPLAAASVRRAVHEKRAALRACYSRALNDGAATAIGILVRFVVLGNGQIDQVRAADPALPDAVSRCIERVFFGLTVPNPASRPVHVAYRVALDS